MSNAASSHPESRRHTKDSDRNRRVPSLRLHKASGQAYVVLSGKAIYCGKPGDPSTDQRYHQALAEWLAAGRQLPADPQLITVKELLARFWAHAEHYYRTLTNGRSKELEQFRVALRPIKELYAETQAADFGPLALQAVRHKMIDKGWCRTYINKQVNRIRHVFKWAVSDELLPSSVLAALQAVPGLKAGRCNAPEAEEERRQRLHEERSTPLSCGNVPGSNRKNNPQWSAGDRYTTDSYRRAIARACDQAFPAPEPLAKCEDETNRQWQERLTEEEKAELSAWRKAHRWHPHQLRHNAATELRKEFGVEAARIIMGHRSAAITEVYAEKDEQKAIEAIMEV